MNYALESIGTTEIIITEEQFQSINLDVMKLKRHHDAAKGSKYILSDLDVNFLFRRLVQVYHALLQKCAKLMFAYDHLIDKTNVIKIKKNQYDTPAWTENFTIVTGFLWEFILDYNPSSGVYFTHYLNLRFKWKALDLWKDLARRNGVSTKKNKRKSYKEVSYDELINVNKELNQKPKIVMFEDIVFDDNFDQIVFEWALEDPVQFVENYDLYQLLSTFTSKQTEAFVLRLQGYKQKQVADELLRKNGVKKITQQAVNERLVAVEKKIKEAGYEPIKE